MKSQTEPTTTAIKNMMPNGTRKCSVLDQQQGVDKFVHLDLRSDPAPPLLFVEETPEKFQLVFQRLPRNIAQDQVLCLAADPISEIASALDGHEMDGRALRVNEARDRKPHGDDD
jgi:hypothetical protein